MVYSQNKIIQNMCYEALVDGPKTKQEINEFVCNKIIETKKLGLIYGLSNLGFRLEQLKKRGVTNTANCKDANEGLLSKGTWYIK